MALIKALETPSGAQATYWRIFNVNQNYDLLEVLVDMAGYLDEAARRAQKDPAQMIRFDFIPGDHPLEELDPDAPNPNLLSDWRNIDQHLIYLHIKAICSLSQVKDAADRTPNEIAALNFVGAQDKF